MTEHCPLPQGLPLQQVLLVTDGGLAGIVYGPAPGFEVQDVLFVPAGLLAEES